MCLGVGELSYDNDLYNRTRPNHSVESLAGNRKETANFKWCEKKLGFAIRITWVSLF